MARSHDLLGQGFPRWWTLLDWWIWTAAISAVAIGALLFWLAIFYAYATFAEAGVVTIPPASRHAQLCAALGADDDCIAVEVAHLRGTLLLVTDDGGDLAFWTTAILTARRRPLAYQMPHEGLPEAIAWATISDPATRWDALVLPSGTWGALRALAKRDDGVPVLASATLLRGGEDASGSALATTGMLKVRIAFMALR